MKHKERRVYKNCPDTRKCEKEKLYLIIDQKVCEQCHKDYEYN